MRSESTSALGQPRLTKPTLGLLRLTGFTLFRRWRDGPELYSKDACNLGLQFERGGPINRRQRRFRRPFSHLALSNSFSRNLRHGSSKTRPETQPGASRTRAPVR